MPADDAPDQEAPSANDEPQEDEDVEGHTYSLTQDPDFGGKALSAEDENVPPEPQRRI
jgi:hypothetical protein